MKQYLRQLLPALSLVFGLLIFSACDANDPGAEGRIQVLLTDAPLDDVAEARVTIQRVELLSVDGGRVVLADREMDFNLLELQNGVTTSLADASVPAGRYDEMRVIVADEATLLFKDGTTSRLKIPSGTESGIKIRVPAFEIDEDSDEVVVVVDFDAGRSFVRAGNSGKYIFKPVLKVDSFRENDDDRNVEDDELKGAVTEIGLDYFVVDGLRFAVDADTDFEDLGGLADLTIGTQVEVAYSRRDDGTLVALEVKRDDD